MRNTILLSLCSVAGLFLSATTANGQNICGFDAIHKEQLSKDLKFKSRLDAFEKFWQEQQALLQHTAERVIVTGTDTVYEIPVVFHVIHTGTAIGTQFNPTDTKIQGVLTYLNQVYGATYPGYPTTATGGVNIPLRFVLAQRDPLCNATTGINRINGVTAFGGTLGTAYNDWGVDGVSTVNGTDGVTDAQLKSLIQWNPGNYYNIWVVNKIDGWSGYVSGGGVVGYAQFAGGPPSSDGTVIMEAFNDAGQTTLPHELGHAFNLYHTFQSGCDTIGSCTSNGDRVCDTDPHDVVSGCPTGINPCTNTSWLPVTYNIMNYTNCTDRFSAGQSARIKTALLQGRGALVQSLGGTLPGAQATYALPAALSVACANPGISNPGNTNDMGPGYIKIADLQSFSSGYNTDGNQVYVNRTGPTCGQAAVAPAHMTIGQTYPVMVSTGFNPENVRAWIDYDNSGSFSAGELVFSSNGAGGDSYRIHTGNMSAVVPATATINIPLRMRVVSDFYGNGNPAACGSNLIYGQAEDFTVIIGNNPLPLSITDITAQAAPDNKSILLQWKSGDEKHTDHYEIESSLDGKSFTRVGTQEVNVRNPVYRFLDAGAVGNQPNFYRLKIADKDQSFTFSKVVSATINSNGAVDIRLYPNPARDMMNIISPVSGTFDMKITNELGQVILSRNQVAIKKDVPVQIELRSAAFAAGLYYIQIGDQSGLSYNGKFVKQ